MPDAAATPPPPAGRPLPSEIIAADSRQVSCDGGGGALGHPRIYMTIPGADVMCPYCSRLYVLKPGAGGDQGH